MSDTTTDTNETTAADGGGYSRTVAVGSSVGLHARPAAEVAKAAGAQSVTVMLQKGDAKPVDARSLLSLLAMGAACGDELVVSAEGDGAKEAVDAVSEVLATDLDA